MNKCKIDHSIFYKQLEAGIILLKVYIDDIVTIGNNRGISSLKSFLHSKFHIKYLGQLKYLLRLEVLRSKKEIFLSQRKCVLDLLAETEKLEAKPYTMPMVLNVHLTKDDDDPLII